MREVWSSLFRDKVGASVHVYSQSLASHAVHVCSLKFVIIMLMITVR